MNNKKEETMGDEDKKTGKYIFTKEELEAQTQADQAGQAQKGPAQTGQAAPAGGSAATLPEVTVTAPAPTKTAVAAGSGTVGAAGAGRKDVDDAPTAEGFDVGGLKVEDVGGLPWNEEAKPQQPVAGLGTNDLREKVAAEKWLQEHPWAQGGDYKKAYEVYKDLTPSQLMRDVATWRQQRGEEVEPWEWYEMLAGRDPHETERERRKEARRAAWADRINAIGDVVNHFVNFGRAMGGNPIAQVQNTYNPEQRERLRMAEEQLRRQRYKDYVDAMERRFKYKDALDAERRRYARQRELAEYKANLTRNPEMEAAQLATEKNRSEAARWNAETARKKALNLPEEQSRAAENHQKRMQLLDSQIKKNNRQGTGSGRKNQAEKLYSYTAEDGTVRSFSTIDAAYEYAMRKAGKEPKKRGKRSTADYEEAGIVVR